MPKPLRYRPPYVGREVAEWVSKIGARSGAYVVRNRKTKRILYVGESHTGRLKKTMLRHFQFWSGFTAGATYPKNEIEVAVRFTPPGSAVAAQDNLICRLDPRDNEIKTRCPDTGDPF